MYFSLQLIGCVIGRKGSKIHEIRLGSHLLLLINFYSLSFHLLVLLHDLFSFYLVHFVISSSLFLRVNSGAQIKIAGNEGDGLDRLVTITGTPEAVGMAQYLINSRYTDMYDSAEPKSNVLNIKHYIVVSILDRRK